MRNYPRIITTVVMAAAVAAVTLGTYTPPLPPAPHFFDYFGDGSEPDPNASGTITLGGEHNYVNFTVQAGATVNIVEDFNNPPSSTLLVRSRGTCTIAGTINGRGAANPVFTIGGVGGGGGGNPSAGELAALGVISPSLDFNGGAGGVLGSPGGAGQDGVPLANQVKTFILDELPSVVDSSGGMPGAPGRVPQIRLIAITRSRATADAPGRDSSLCAGKPIFRQPRWSTCAGRTGLPAPRDPVPAAVGAGTSSATRSRTSIVRPTAAQCGWTAAWVGLVGTAPRARVAWDRQDGRGSFRVLGRNRQG
jgi:hypothetical protein